MKWLKAATNTHREAASSSQLAAAHPMARRVSDRSSRARRTGGPGAPRAP